MYTYMYICDVSSRRDISAGLSSRTKEHDERKIEIVTEYGHDISTLNMWMLPEFIGYLSKSKNLFLLPPGYLLDTLNGYAIFIQCSQRIV